MRNTSFDTTCTRVFHYPVILAHVFAALFVDFTGPTPTIPGSLLVSMASTIATYRRRLFDDQSCLLAQFHRLHCLIMSTDCHMSSYSHQEGTSEPSMRQVTKAMRSLQQTVERLSRQYLSVARDIEELKKGKSSASMDPRIGDNFGGINSPYHQRSYNNVYSRIS
ncbi:hypothetical protein M9H77_07320 [Catharanthus roseus]|uniref:Uncharacterized protein n=1 Tax=Catharanthus roseus TaxID=4058 RepID=A0ACC0BUK4_CATRO|nr:hypothetical protein M9H77_07320 [Catharanthus roseus]